MIRAGLVALLLASLTLLTVLRPVITAKAASAQCAASASVDEAGDLTINVSEVVTDAPTLLTIPVSGQPAAYAAYENGSPLPVSVNNSLIEVAVYDNGTVTVQYLSLTATSKEGALWYLNLTMPCEGWLSLPPGSVTVYVTPVPLNAVVVNGSPRLLLQAGEANVEYMVSQELASAGPTRTTVARPPRLEWLAAPVAVAAGVAIAVALIIRRGSRGEGGQEEGLAAVLDERDRAILSFVARSGRATASQIMSGTGIPRTPLYRRLDKLVKMGLLKEERQGSAKYYRCAEGCQAST